MAFNYIQAQKTARRLLDNFGASVTFNRVGGGTFDPVAGEETGASTTTETVKVVSLPASKGTIQAFDKKIFEDLSETEIRFFHAELNTNSFEPQPGDLINYGSKIWEVVGVTPLDPTGSKPVLFNIGSKLSGRSVIP